MKKHRIVQIGKNKPEFKVQEKLLFFWVNKIFNIAEENYLGVNEVQVKEYLFNNLNDARYVLDNYKEILYNGETIYPCIKKVRFNINIQIFYFRLKDKMPGYLDAIKKDIDRDVKLKIESEKSKKERIKDRKYKKVVYTE